MSHLPQNLTLTDEQIKLFCQKWQVTELALFGSVLRADFNAQSDVDILVTFAPEIKRSLFDLMHMAEELEPLLGRKVDILTKKSVQRSHNWLRKQHILTNSEVIYEEVVISPKLTNYRGCGSLAK